MYGTMPNIKRLLNPAPAAKGTISGAIFIGTAGSAQCGTTFAIQMNNDAGSFIDGMLVKRYKLPFGTPYPAEIKFICERLAAGYIIIACKQYTADSASNFLYDKQQTYHQLAMSKLQALADGMEHLVGKQVDSYPQGEHDASDKFHFKVPGSSNVRPAEGL